MKDEYGNPVPGTLPCPAPPAGIPGPDAIIQARLAVDLDAERPRRVCVIHYRHAHLGEMVRTYDHIPPESWSRLAVLARAGDRTRTISQEWYPALLRVVARLGGWYTERPPERCE